MFNFDPGWKLGHGECKLFSRKPINITGEHFSENLMLYYGIYTIERTWLRSSISSFYTPAVLCKQLTVIIHQFMFCICAAMYNYDKY